MLGLRMNQQSNGNATTAEIQSNETFGFGLYTWRARMSSVAMTPYGPGAYRTGSTSALFIFLRGRTEIDLENENWAPDHIHFVTWADGSNSYALQASVSSPSETFHDYGFRWSSDRIEWILDGATVSVSRQNIPSTPAYVLINHWGTDQPGWGGAATPNVPRMMWVSHFSYSPT
jgi:endo-1,3-1,4-beta-glycanase ExoK